MQIRIQLRKGVLFPLQMCVVHFTVKPLVEQGYPANQTEVNQIKRLHFKLKKKVKEIHSYYFWLVF